MSSKDFLITSITVSAEEKNYSVSNRGSFVSWTVKSPEEGWNVEEAHKVTLNLHREVTKSTLLSQLVKAAITKEEYDTKSKILDQRSEQILKKWGGDINE